MGAQKRRPIVKLLPVFSRMPSDLVAQGDDVEGERGSWRGFLGGLGCKLEKVFAERRGVYTLEGGAVTLLAHKLEREGGRGKEGLS